MKNWSRFAFFVVAVLWGGSFAFQKTLLDTITPYNFTFWNFFISGVVLLFITLARKSNLFYRFKEGLVLGVLLAGMEIFQMIGLKYSSSADAAFISNLGMLLIPYAGWIFFRHRISKLSNVAIVVAFFGLYLLVGGPMGFGGGQMALLICAGMMSLYFLYSQRFEGERNSHLIVLLVQQFFTTALCCAIVVVFFGETFSVPPGVQMNLLAQILILTTLPYIIIQWASRYADEMTATIYDGVVEPLVGGIAAWVFFVEPATRLNVIGGLIMVVAFALGSIFSNKHFLQIGRNVFRTFRKS